MASGSRSSTSSQTVTQNQQVGASEGAVAAGAGATVNIQNLSGEVTEAALNAVVQQGAQAAAVAGESVREQGDTAREATTAIRGVASDALSTTERTTREALGFGTESQAQVFDFAKEFLAQSERQQQSTQNFARQQSELVAAGAGVTSPALVGETITQFGKLIAIGAVAVVAIVFLNKRKAA